MLPLPEAERVLAGAGLIPDLATDEVETRLKTGLRLRETGLRILAFYLEEMDRRKLYLGLGYSSTAFFASDVLELEKRRTSELLAVGRKLRTLPRIDAAFCAQQLSWSKLLYLLEVATPEHEAAWLALALKCTCQKLRTEVRSANPGDPPRKPGDGKGTPQITFPIRTRVSPLLHQKLELAQAMLAAERERPVTLPEVLEELADLYLGTEADGTIPGRKRVNSSLYRIVLRPEEQLEPDTPLALETGDGPIPVDASAVREHAKVLVVEDSYPAGDPEGGSPPNGTNGKLAPKTPAKLREMIVARDGCRCRTCGSHYHPQVHHILFRSEGGPTRGANLDNECPRCHALLHAGLLIVEGTEASKIRFKNRQGRYLNEPGQWVDEDTLMALHREELAETPETAAPEVVSLDQVPDVVDGAWWLRYADFVRFVAGKGLVLREGAPVPEPVEAEQPAEATPDAEGAFAGLVGLDDSIERIRKRAVGRAARGRPFPHTLFLGPAGTGKTTLARGIATLLGTRLHTTTGPLLEDVHALVRILADLREGDVLFLDEIHRVPTPVLEVLYEAMSDRRLELTLHAGSRTRFVRLALPAFTLLAATTEHADLPEPLVSRFGLREMLGYYDTRSLTALVDARARAEGVALDAAGARRLADCARGTPREALRLLDLVLDEAKGDVLDAAGVEAALAGLGYDREGLRAEERAYLATIEALGGAVALGRLARMLGMSPRAVERDLEPHLLRTRRAIVTPQGRCLPPPPGAGAGAAASGVVQGLTQSGYPDWMSRTSRRTRKACELRVLSATTRRRRSSASGPDGPCDDGRDRSPRAPSPSRR